MESGWGVFKSRQFLWMSYVYCPLRSSWFVGIWELCVFLQPIFYFHIYYTCCFSGNLSTLWIIKYQYMGIPKCTSGNKIIKMVTEMSCCITTIHIYYTYIMICWDFITFCVSWAHNLLPNVLCVYVMCVIYTLYMLFMVQWFYFIC